MALKPKVSVIYLTYEAAELVKETLSLLIKSLHDIPFAVEIIVVDNGSKDGSQDYIKSLPLKSVLHDRNTGFSAGCNSGAKQAAGEYLFFINNDIKVKGDFLTPLVKLYESKKNVFAVGPKFLRWDEVTLDDAARNPFYERGLLDVRLETDNLDKVQPMVFFLGGGFLVKKDMFYKLGLFDEIYSPFSWEDLDLGYRAVKRGYINYYCPSVTLYHQREATTKTRFSENYFKSTVWRNRFIFTWRNLTDRELLTDHLLSLPWKLIRFLFNGRWPYVWGFFKALGMIFVIFRKRKLEAGILKINDKKILDGTWKNAI